MFHKANSKYYFNKKFFWGIILAIILAAIDLYSKEAIFEFINNSETPSEIVITSFFSLVKVWNSGVSFGMFNNLANGKIIISTINIMIMMILLVLLYRANNSYNVFSFSFIIGGAIGNLVDRLQNNAVADFLDFHFKNYHWPAFNLADSFVFIGVALLLLENFLTKPETHNEKK